MNKAEALRKSALEARRKLSQGERDARSARIFARVCGLGEIVRARWVLSYVSLPEEADTSALLK
ncbi:MAG: 5-formyltetrahydrofolate cyclo-ligase, partial [bacterium]